MPHGNRPPVEPSPLPPPIEETAPLEPYGDRFELGGRSLRQRAARGALVNSGFQVGLAGLALLRNLAVAAFLTASEFGLWGLVITTILTLAWLKQVGIGDKYIQQDETDQVAAFHKAFTLEVAYSLLFFALAVAVLPLYALIYDRSEILVPGIALSFALLASALQAPVWIPYRQMRFVRQRLLEAVDPVVSTAVVIGLAISGAGYWALVIGILAGSLVGGVVALASSPYPLRFRYDPGTLREYAAFSWPLLASGVSGLVVVQGTVIIGNYTVGLAGIGAIGLAGQVAKFADQVDAVIARTIYPAVCAVKDRVDLLFETFVKSNRVALMWGMPFGVALTLFASDLVRFVLGESWLPAEALLQGFGLIFAFRQVAFNWMLFFSARGETRPLAVEGVVIVVVFVFVTAPLLIAIGLDGYLIGIAATVLAQLAVRAHYLARLFAGFGFLGYLARSAAPTAVGAGVVLAERALLDPQPSLGLAAVELAGYALVTGVMTWVLERNLIAELLGYLRGAAGGIESVPAGGGSSA
jgi:PST family polysaccharide transporter